MFLFIQEHVVVRSVVSDDKCCVQKYEDTFSGHTKTQRQVWRRTISLAIDDDFELEKRRTIIIVIQGTRDHDERVQGGTLS